MMARAEVGRNLQGEEVVWRRELRALADGRPLKQWARSEPLLAPVPA